MTLPDPYEIKPKDWPIDLGNGIRAQWHGTALWIHWPRFTADGIEGRIVTTGPHPWQLVSREPLTIRPSVRLSDGSNVTLAHGFITNGRWEPCGDDPK